jgi:hypothetical protein
VLDFADCPAVGERLPSTEIWQKISFWYRNVSAWDGRDGSESRSLISPDRTSEGTRALQRTESADSRLTPLIS